MKTYLLCALLIGAMPLGAQAMNKCLGGNGQLTYTDTPCPAGTKSDKPPRTREALESKIAADTSGRKTADQIMASGSWDLVQALILVEKLASQPAAGPDQALARACLERYRNAYKDPQSAYVVTSSIWQGEADRFVNVEVSAKNGFGGGVRSELVCSVN